MTSAGGLSAPAVAATAATKGATTAHVPATKATTAFHEALATASDKLRPVKGHAYSKVVSGPDKGMYVNTTHNARAGERFSIEYHDGRRWNVYGEGAHRTIIAFPKAAAPAAAPATGGSASDKTGTGTAGTTAGTTAKTGTAKAPAATTPAPTVPSTGTTTSAPTFDDGTTGDTSGSTASA